MTASGLVDLLIPRGGAGLIRACVESATVPCIETGTGICHVYVDKDADLEKALNIIENAKTSRPSVCNAEEVALVHRDVAGAFLPRLKARLVDARAAAGKTPVELRLDAAAQAIARGLTEYFGLPFIYPQLVRIGVVTTEGSALRLRSYPGIDGEIVGSIPNGESVQVYGSFQGWYSVGYDGQLGYAAQAYIAV